MPQHTAMLPIPELCRDAGLNVKTLDGWDTWEPGYYWTAPDGSNDGYAGPPNGHIHHHTATAEYTPNVVANGKSKANMYAGLARSGTDRLYSTSGGTPIVVFAVAGPANYGNGNGWSWVIDNYVARDVEFDGPARNHADARDDRYANRYMLGTEYVHRGDGSELNPGLFELMCQVSAIIDNHFGWSQWRNIGHEDSTTRKVDPKYAQGAPYTMAAIRTRIAQIHGGATPPEEDDMNYYPRRGDVDDRDTRDFGVERVQAKLAILDGGNPDRPNRGLIEDAGMLLGTFDDRTAELAERYAHNADAIGPTEDRRYLDDVG